MNSIKPKQREGSLRGIRLAKGEVVPLMSDNLFKKVYGDTEHLERLNYLLSSILDKDVKVIKILNNELIGDYRLNQKKYVDLVCKIGELDYVNVEGNTVYNAYEIDRNVEFIFRLASASHKPDKKLSKEERERIRKAKKYYIQINLNTKNTNNKPYVSFSLNDDEDPKFKLTNMVKIININVSTYRDLCYNKNINELSDFEIAVGIIGIYEEKMLEKIGKRNQVLKGISDIVKKYSFEDDVIVAYDREEFLKEAYEANIEYAVADAVEETTLEIAKKMKKANYKVDDIANITGLTKEQIDKI